MYRLLKLLIGLSLLALLVWLLDWGAALRALAKADPGWVIGAFLVSVLGVLISAGKWQGLLQESRVPLGFVPAARLYWIGMFFSNFLPSSVGGDAVRLMLTPSHGRTGRVAGSIVAERLTGFLVMLALCLVGLISYPWLLPDPKLQGLLIASVLALAVAAAVLLFAPGTLAAIFAYVLGFLPRILQRIGRKVQNVALAVAAQRRQGRALTRALLLSLPFYGTIVLAQYCVLQAVGAQVRLVDVLLLGPIVPLLTILPVSLNGIGVAEGAFVAIFAAIGVTPELALAAAVLRRIVDLANSALGGLFWLAYRGEEKLAPA